MRDRDCVFCKIITGEEPKEFLYEDAHAAIFVPLNPVVPGHVLVVSRTHIEDFGQDPYVAARTIFAAAEYASRMLDEGLNLITSVGKAATQTIFHLHLHLVPRNTGDGLKLPWSDE